MRVRSRCQRCRVGIDLPRTGGPRPRLCHRCYRLLRLRVLAGAAVTRVRDVLAGAVRRVWVRFGRRDRIVWERAESGTDTPAPEPCSAVAPVVPSQGHAQ